MIITKDFLKNCIFECRKKYNIEINQLCNTVVSFYRIVHNEQENEVNIYGKILKKESDYVDCLNHVGGCLVKINTDTDKFSMSFKYNNNEKSYASMISKLELLFGLYGN